MDREKRKSDTSIPENLEEMLNEVQQQALPGIKYLGWEPRFLRKPMFQAPELVIQNSSDGRTGILDVDGQDFADVDAHGQERWLDLDSTEGASTDYCPGTAMRHSRPSQTARER